MIRQNNQDFLDYLKETMEVSKMTTMKEAKIDTLFSSIIGIIGFLVYIFTNDPLIEKLFFVVFILSMFVLLLIKMNKETYIITKEIGGK